MRNIFFRKNVSTIKDSEQLEDVLSPPIKETAQNEAVDPPKSISSKALYVTFFIFGNIIVILLFLFFYFLVQ
jgi:hypothetical protein